MARPNRAMLKLLSRDQRYFERFTELAVRIREGADALDGFFRRQEPLPKVAERVKDLEHECDRISHEILRSIDQTFITPIDREDIHRLAIHLDDVMDLIDGTIRRVSLFHIAQPTPYSQKLSEIIVSTTRELVEAVADLKGRKGVVAHCIRIKQFENEGDTVFHDAVASLFAGDIAPIEVIKWKDVYENMERCLDSCELVAHILESVVLKTS
jgi:uncharacterized protein Yka (UPF0111/DUF47 family)